MAPATCGLRITGVTASPSSPVRARRCQGLAATPEPDSISPLPLPSMVPAAHGSQTMVATALPGCPVRVLLSPVRPLLAEESWLRLPLLWTAGATRGLQTTRMPASPSSPTPAPPFPGRVGSPEPGWIFRPAFPSTAQEMCGPSARIPRTDRKSTRLNSSHLGISYAVFCLKTYHKHARSWLEEGLDGPVRLALPGLSLPAFLFIHPRPPPTTPPLPPDDPLAH